MKMRMENGRFNKNHMIITGKLIDGLHGNILNPPKKKTDQASGQNGQGFKDILRTSIDSNREIKFSKHATQRMLERNIKLSTVQLQSMENALEKARDKGAKDSLLLMGNTAFIVNVPSRTIITAVDNVNRRENVFTNIDSAIII